MINNIDYSVRIPPHSVFLQSLLKQKVMPKRKQNYYNGDKKVTRTEQCIFVVKKRCLVFSTFASQATVAGSSRF